MTLDTGASPELSAEDFEIRPMGYEDLDAVLDLERQCFGDPWSRASFESEVDDPDGLRWPLVAWRRTRLAGYILTWFVLDEAHIANVAVAPMFRFLGLGRRLVQTVIDEARRRRVRWIGLEARVTNDAALALYRRLGFQVTGRRRRYYRDTGEDALVLTLDLTRRREPGCPG